MLQGHFISHTYEDYSFMVSELRANGTSGSLLFDYWVQLRKFTAPLFFTITGLVFAYLLTKNDAHSFWKKIRVKKGIRRAITIIIWGYVLQLNYQNISYAYPNVSKKQGASGITVGFSNAVAVLSLTLFVANLVENFVV